MRFYKTLWLGVYIFANLIAAILFFVSGELDGDLIGYPLPGNSVLVVATFSIVLSYLVWMGPVFNLLSKIRIRNVAFLKKTVDTKRAELLVGGFVLCIQFFFLVFNMVEGVNIAGSRLHSDSPLRYLWILLAPDALFLIYYGLYRKSHLFLINLFVFVVSNSMRGWLSTWLFVFFIEGAYRIRENRLNFKKVVVALIVFLPFLPVLMELKWTIRELGSTGALNVNEVLDRLLFFVTNFNWWEAFTDTIRSIVMRLQYLANVIGIIDQADVISAGLTNRDFLYFFEEGLPQYTFLKLFGNASVPDIHNTLLTYLVPYQLPFETITNTHVGLVGWFWISPKLFPLYLIYVGLLSWAGIFLTKLLRGNNLLTDIVWLVWLVYLMNSWFGAYIQFLQALVIMIILRMFLFKYRQKIISSKYSRYRKISSTSFR